MAMRTTVFGIGLGVAGLLAAPLGLVRLRERIEPRQLPGAQRFIVAGGYRLHYTDEGPPTGQVVVLCHGFASWAFAWRNQRRALVAAGYRVISIDQLGYGASERVAAPVYSTRDQCDLLLDALDRIGVERAHLVGHSFGGRVALQAAIVAPARVRSLVAICPETFATTRPPIAAVVAAPLLGFALAYYSLAPALVPLGLRSLSGSGAWVTREVARGYAAPLAVRGSVASQVWQARSPKDGALPVPRNLGAIGCPTLLLWGERDTVFPPGEGERLAGELRHARLRLLEGVGHLPHEERADEVNREILAFLAGLE
jgi:pimeloyl-ACP methyl ester carboxylesterase